MLKSVLEKFLTWSKPSQETVEASIRRSMWIDGYSDLEIEIAIEDYRQSVARDTTQV